MEIGGLQKLTLIDYPGQIACTLFLVGCNFRCPWCYSSEIVLPDKITKQPKVSNKEFLNFLDKRKGFLDGVVICGGEPTINKDLPDFIKKIKKLGYLLKLDTNGSNPEMLKKLIDKKLIDYVAMDIKAPIGAKMKNEKLKIKNYDEATGVKIDLEKIKKSIDILKEGKVEYEFRSTILPQLHCKEDIVNMAKWIQGAKVYYLQQFRPEKTINPEYEKCNPFNSEELEIILKACNIYVPTKLRG